MDIQGANQVANKQYIDAHGNMMTAAENMNSTLIKFKTVNAEMADAWQGHSGSVFAEVSKNMENRFDTLNHALSMLTREIDEALASFDKSR